MALIELFHAGFQEIRNVDIRIGRTNADFGQGFYLSPDEGFCRRWAREKRGQNAWINGYTLCTEGLNIKEFRRDGEWYDYIFRNRAGYPDSLSEYDVIMGPIANDTIYNLWGVTTSGFLSREESLGMLLLGPEYRQVVVKTERAVGQLQFRSAQIIPAEEIRQYREAIAREEQAFQYQAAAFLQAAEES